MIRIYISAIVAFLVMHLVSNMTAFLPYIVGAAITPVIVLLVLVASYKWVVKAKGGALIGQGIRSVSITALLPSIIVSFALLLMYPVVGYALNVKMVMAEGWLLNIVAIFLSGGIAEETLFRGFFYEQLSKRMSERKAIGIATLFFTLVHLLLFTYLDFPVALLSTILAAASSMPFIYLYLHGARTIWSGAIVHTIMRTIGLVVTTKDVKYPLVALWWLVACMVVPYIVLLFYKDFRVMLSAKYKTDIRS